MKTRPTNRPRVDKLSDDKVKAGYQKFHGAGIVFHTRETKADKLEKIVQNILDGKGDKKTDVFYIVAENHNILSSKKAYKTLKDAGDEAYKNFEFFECYVLTYPKKKEGQDEESFVKFCQKVFRDVS